MKKIILSIIFLATFAGLAGLWYSQKNVYSKEVLKLEILGPEKAEMGEEIEYIVRYKNNGQLRLEGPLLIFEYPEHSLTEGKGSLREERELEDIYPGEERTISFRARLLGREGENKEARAWLSYSPKNLKARYESKTTFSTIIARVALVFEIDSASRVEPGKDLRFRLNYFSNVQYPLSGLRCLIEPSSGFEFVEASPKPDFGEKADQIEWNIPILNKAEGGRIEVVGRLKGNIGEEKIFKIKLGMWRDGEFILLKEAIKGIQLSRPSLYISQQINNNPHYLASPGDLLHYEIFFKNIGEEPLSDMFLIAKLEGNGFDFQTLKRPQGNFEPSDNSIIWDSRQIPKLRFLDSQEEGKVEFWIELKKEWGFAGAEDENPVLRNEIILSQAREEFLTKVNSKLALEQKAYFEDDVFANSGQLPPQTGQTTTYTLIWQVKNFYNPLNDVKVKAVLPADVRLTGKIFPEDSRLTFDSQSREVVWEIGDIEPGQGIVSEGKACAFQVALTPGEGSAEKDVFALVGEANASALDQWTEAVIEARVEGLDTE